MRHLFSVLFSSSSSILAVIAMSSAALPLGTSSTSLTLSGRVQGVWELPTSSTGFLQGSLLSVDGSYRLFALEATLVGVRSGCLSCTDGEIVGTLDDGVGPGPDFEFRGHYHGFWFTGLGSYAGRIFRPGGATPLGSIEGKFGDPSSPGPVLGVFGGRFRLRG